MSSKINRKEYKGIDIMKLVMAMVVVASHTKLYNGSNETILTIYNIILSLVVPYFFLVSGFFRYKETNQDQNMKDALLKTIKLYIIWNIIYLPISIYSYILNGYSIRSMFLNYMRGFFFIGEHFFSWQLWYLLALIYSYIGILILRKFKLSDKKILIITFFIYLFSIIMSYILETPYNNVFIHAFDYIFTSSRLFKGIFLVTLGIYINKYKISVSKVNLIIFIILGFLIAFIFNNNTFLYELGKLIMYITIFLLVMQLNNIKIKTQNIRKSSTVFYFLHMINLFIMLLIVGSEEYVYGLYPFLINILMCCIESVIIIFLQKKYNFKILNELFN